MSMALGIKTRTPREGDYNVQSDMWGAIWIEVYTNRQWYRVPLLIENRASILVAVLGALPEDVRAALLASDEPRHE